MDLRTLVRTSIWMNFLVNIGDFSFIGSPINARLKDSVKLGVSLWLNGRSVDN